MFNNYNTAFETHKVQRGINDWYQLAGIVIRKMIEEDNILPGNTSTDRLFVLEKFVIEHIVDTLMMNEKISLMNYLLKINLLEIPLFQMQIV